MPDQFEWRIYWPRAESYTVNLGSYEEAELVRGRDNSDGHIQRRRITPWETVAPASRETEETK